MSDNSTNEIRNGKRKVSGNVRCRQCANLIPRGEYAWFAVRGPRITSSAARCVSCGPNPELRLPREQAEPTRAPRTQSDDSALQLRIDVLEEQVIALRERVKTAPSIIEVRRPNENTVRVEGAHAKLAEVLKLVGAGFDNIYTVGPAGSGKTTLAAQVAKALSRPFGFLSLSGGTSESKLTGNLRPQADGSWKWFTPAFVAIFENGGVFLLDEMDGADPNVLVAINAALANGELEVDSRIVKRHADCVIIAAANTFGTGADAMYVGRNPLDAATLDRFIGAIVEVDYDRSVERRYAEKAGEKGAEFLAWVWQVRDRAQKERLQRVIGTRMVQAGVKLLNGGFSMHETKERMFSGWSADERRKVS